MQLQAPWDTMESHGAGVDWITVTYARDTEVHNYTLAQVLPLIRGFAQGGGVGYKVKSFGTNGYSGISIAGAAWARREDSAMMKLSGYSGGLFQDLPDIDQARCTRLDVRLDCKWPAASKPALAHWAYNASREYKRTNAGRPWKQSIIVGDDGNTCYLGSRQSAMMIRVYDKEAESGLPEYKGVWRIEIEFKEDLANELFHRLRRVRDVDAAACGLVVTHSQRRGLSIPLEGDDRWEPEGFHHQGVTDNLRSLEWLRGQVSPTVRRLLREGLRDDIIRALGLHIKQGAFDDSPTTYTHGSANHLGGDS